jgi:polyhydroxyalkanoate synthase subunit PhaC
MTKPLPPPPDAAAYRIDDPDEFARNILKVYEEGGRAMTEFIERKDAQITPFSAASEASLASQTISEVFTRLMADPARLAQAQTKLVTSYAELWNNTIRKVLGDDVRPVVEPAPNDSRFRDPEWSTNPYFDFWKQAYLLTSNWAERVLAETEGLDEAQRHKAEFYFRQVSSACSPSNFPVTNPEVVRETFATNARNLVSGMSQLAEDMQGSGDLLKISQTDAGAFEVGRNLGTTPGKVVFQNEIFQLLQYTPTTDKVREVPLLMVPPWINKFYILDLTQEKSFIKFAVDQGFTVFVVSWVNPDVELAHKTFEDYMTEGLLTAADAVRRETNMPQCNVLGYCVGGTLLGTTLAWLAARGETPFKSVTFLTTQVDFRKAGDLLLFTDDNQLASLEQVMQDRGYLDGSRMANVFNMMRPKDLIWPYIVNNYLLGRKPFPFDLLYWNQDSTRISAANHAFYLREFYNENRLSKGEMSMGGITLDLSKVTLPIYELATRDDHIAPAESVFLGAKKFSGPVEFVLAGSGHIAGVVNPPAKVKYQYWTKPKFAGDTLAEWLQGTTETKGSWWPHWVTWLTTHSGGWTVPREPGSVMGVIEDAPGSYVKKIH